MDFLPPQPLLLEQKLPLPRDLLPLLDELLLSLREEEHEVLQSLDDLLHHIVVFHVDVGVALVPIPHVLDFLEDL